ncbi:MAG: hypothetical protein IPM24_19635 [Bryobacterales bacterium]|nr:hypothetical protein [Bryobacterales bacterium]
MSRTIDDGCGSVLSASEQDHVRSYWKSIKNILLDWRTRYQWPQGIDRETSVKNRNDLENAIHQDLEELSYLRKTTFDAVMKWGFGRSSNLSETDIARSTRSAFEHLRSGRLAEAARALCELRGVGISRASKILALSDQRELAIYDSRAAHGLRKLVDQSEERLVPIPPGRVIRGDTGKDFNQGFQRYICVLRLLREWKIRGGDSRARRPEGLLLGANRATFRRDTAAPRASAGRAPCGGRSWQTGRLTGEQFQTASKMLTPQHHAPTRRRSLSNKGTERRRTDCHYPPAGAVAATRRLGSAP